MLDINLLRKDLDGVVARLQARKNPQAFLDVEGFKTLEAERKTIQTRSEDLQATRNRLSKEVGQRKSKGEPADDLLAQVAALKTELEVAGSRNESIQAELLAILQAVPNLQH